MQHAKEKPRRSGAEGRGINALIDTKRGAGDTILHGGATAKAAAVSGANTLGGGRVVALLGEAVALTLAGVGAGLARVAVLQDALPRLGAADLTHLSAALDAGADGGIGVGCGRGRGGRATGQDQCCAQ